MIVLHRARFVRFAVIYAFLIVYSSLLIGPLGIHFVPISPSTAWHKFLAMPFVSHDSDQRSDWVGNLMMLVPLGYALTGAAGLGFGRAKAWLTSIIAFSVAILFILSVKFSQLYFPPRTVTINYVTAQTVGATIGIIGFWLTRTRWAPLMVHMSKRGEGLAVITGLYTAVMIFYFLMPFDFALSGSDLVLQLARLPHVLFGAPGEGKSLPFRFLLILANTFAMIPVGMFLALTDRTRSIRSLVFRGFRFMLVVTGVTMLILSGSPFLLALIYRTVGIALGVWLMVGMRGKDLRWWHYRAARLVPIAFIIYAIAVIYASGLLTSEWRSFDEAVRAFDTRGYLPFWHSYIVSKSRAASSFVIHFFIFAPIGILLWFKRAFWRYGATISGILAFLFSLAMEFGRWMKPGLQPDFSDPIVAAIGAAVAFRLMPVLFSMFEHEATIGIRPVSSTGGRGAVAAASR